MTTPPIMSVTDELIAELQDVAHGKDEDAIEVHGVSVGIVRALLSERAELKRDAERYRWLIENADMMHWENMLRFADLDGPESVGQFIDAAMTL